MNFWEALALVGTSATILGVFLTVYGIINNRILKNESKLTREMIKETSAEISKMIKEMGQEIAQLIVTEGAKTRSTFESK